MPEQATDREKVDFALRTEKDGIKFYDEAKERTDHKLARAAFTVLSEQERRHVGLIEALSRELSGGGKPVGAGSPTLGTLQRSLRTIYEGAMSEGGKKDMQPADAYGRAIELEKRVSSLYFRYGREAESKEAKRLFSVLYREEQDHLTLLEDMLAYLTDPGRWFIDRDWVLLDGGGLG
jgi:rubrerythrin